MSSTKLSSVTLPTPDSLHLTGAMPPSVQSDSSPYPHQARHSTRGLTFVWCRTLTSFPFKHNHPRFGTNKSWSFETSQGLSCLRFGVMFQKLRATLRSTVISQMICPIYQKTPRSSGALQARITRERTINTLIRQSMEGDYISIHNPLNALVEIGEPAVEPLIDALNRPQSPMRNLTRCIVALSQIGSENAVLALFRRLTSENLKVYPSEGTQQILVLALGNFSERRIVTLLQETIQQTPFGPVVRTAEASIAKITLAKMGEEVRRKFHSRNTLERFDDINSLCCALMPQRNKRPASLRPDKRSDSFGFTGPLHSESPGAFPRITRSDSFGLSGYHRRNTVE